MTRKLLPLLLLATGASSSSLAGSFFENQLRQIIDVTKRNGDGADSTTKTQPTENASKSRASRPTSLTNPDQSPPAQWQAEVISKDEYCQKVSRNASIRKYINFAKKYQHPYQLTGFLDPEQLLSQWVAQRAEESGGKVRKSTVTLGDYSTKTAYSIDRWPLGDRILNIFAQCAIDSINSDDFLFYAAYAKGSADNARQEIMNEVDKHTPKQEEKTMLDEQGNIVAAEPAPQKNIQSSLYNRINDILLTSSHSNVSEYTAVFYAVALPNGEKALSAAAQGSFENMAKLLVQQEANAKAETAKAKDSERNGDELVKYFAYLTTDEGKLFTGYKYTQLIEACRKAREGMAAVYVSSSEYDAVKTKIKRIESALTPKIRVKSDKVWDDATFFNRGSTPFNEVDMLEWIKTAKFQEGSRACDSFKVEFQKNALGVLGPDEVKKNF